MKNIQDEQFTNKENIEYPSLNETADIRVINNNIKILEEEKANLSNLQDVAKETTPNNIENKVIQLQDKIEKLEKHIKDNNEYYYDLPNLTPVFAIGKNDFVSTNMMNILNIQGSGYLVASNFNFQQMSNSDEIYAIKITIDGKPIYWQEYIMNRYGTSNGGRYGGIGNVQCVSSITDTTQVALDMKFGGDFTTRIPGKNNINSYKYSKLSDKRIVIDDPKEFNTTYVLFNKGIRFEKSLKIEAMQRYSTGISQLNILYSLDD